MPGKKKVETQGNPTIIYSSHLYIRKKKSYIYSYKHTFKQTYQTGQLSNSEKVIYISH